MHPDLKKIPTAELVDLLSEKTQRLTQLLSEKKFGEEYGACKEAIQQILAEIAFRRDNAATDNSSPSESSSSHLPL